MKTTVDGIEMFCANILVGTAVCDGCGVSVYWDKYSRFGQEFRDKTEGWVFSELRSGATAYCPDCKEVP